MYKLNILNSIKYVTISNLDLANARDAEKLKAAGGLLVLSFLMFLLRFSDGFMLESRRGNGDLELLWNI